MVGWLVGNLPEGCLGRRECWSGGGGGQVVDGKRPFGSGWFCRLSAIQKIIFLSRAFYRRRNVALLLIVVWSHSI
jgi:hypothetical protein